VEMAAAFASLPAPPGGAPSADIDALRRLLLPHAKARLLMKAASFSTISPASLFDAATGRLSADIRDLFGGAIRGGARQILL